MQELPPGPLQSEALQTINSAVTARDQAIVQPLKNEAMREADRISRSTDPPEQRLQQLDELARAGMVDPKDLTEVRNRIERERNELESPDGKARQELIDAEVKRLERFLSVGGLSDKEQMQIVSYKAELRKNVAQIVNNGHSQRLPSDQIDQRVKQFLASQTADLTGRIERNTGVNRQPLISDINKYYDDRGLARNGRPPMGQSLRSAVDNAVVMPKPDFEKALNDLAFNNSISPQINQIIKDSGYGGNAGDFFLKQWKQQYPGIPFPERFKTQINRLNGQRLSFAAPPSTSGFGMITPGAAFQRNLGSIINTIVNQTIGGASAAPREPSGEMGYTGTPPVGTRNAVTSVATKLGIDPIALAAVISKETGGTFNKDIQGGEGGNYRGLIQFGPSERRTYGYRDGMSFEEQMVGPVYRYLKARGVRPGHTAQEIYAAILTGNVANISQGGLDWKDSFGTSVRNSLPGLTRGGHYRNARRFLGL